MKIEEATHIEVEANVRYWEDATVNGVEDTHGKLIPGRDGKSWKALINLVEGRIESWPEGTVANIHYKVCDAGLYWLTDSYGKRFFQYGGDYVPDDFLCHGDHGFSDYIIMRVEGDGKIADYTPGKIAANEWEVITNG